MNCKVLIVDDSPILRRAAKKAVLQAGIEEDEIFEAGNGEEALGVASSHPIDLVLLDLNMPIMSGVEFMEKVKESPQLNTKFSVIVVSTESNQQKFDTLKELGVKGFLRKPFEPEELRNMVQQTVR
ncbi:MAG TPA: response regulator [Planctomycetes bacterium]|nr:response regulator [Planctomycetota bacterium]